MKTIALILIMSLLGIASRPTFSRERINAVQKRLALISAALAGILFGVVLVPVPFPYNLLIGLGLAASFSLMIAVALLPDHTHL